MQDESDLTLIVRGYLTGLSDDSTINSLAARIVRFYKAVVTDSTVFRDGSNCKPHFSLRTLCRTLVHARHTYNIYGLTRALCDGIAMNFQTLLDPPSAAIMAKLLREHLQLEGHARDLSTRPSQPTSGAFVPLLEFWCPRGPLEPQLTTEYILVPSVKDSIRGILRAVVSVKFPVLLQGPTSSGKTSMVEYLVRCRNLEYIVVFYFF